MPIIHEGTFSDIIELISGNITKKVKDSTSEKVKFKSLTKNTNDLILTFPVLCTSGISIETASMITRAVEKNCAKLLQLYLASIQIDNSIDLQTYISKFHKNISLGDKITVDDFINFTDSLSTTSLDFINNESVDMSKITDREVAEIFKRCMPEINNIAKTSLNEYSLSNFICHKTNNGYETVLDEVARPKNQSRDYISHNFKIAEKMSDMDIKKANELMPTTIIVNFYSTNANTKFEGGLLGVKGKLYPADSMEIISRIATKYSDTNWIKDFIRASTGEISFWRDFVFGLDRARVDAINATKKGSSSKMWKVLERRATKNKLAKWKANRASSAPITTLVISQDEVEYLKKEYNINMENRNIAIKLMDEYNFMGIVIVNEPAEYASFIWDEGNNANYETLSFSHLERESSDKNYKKVINLMTKISR